MDVAIFIACIALGLGIATFGVLLGIWWKMNNK